MIWKKVASLPVAFDSSDILKMVRDWSWFGWSLKDGQQQSNRVR